jgi:hypothetical protein
MARFNRAPAKQPPIAAFEKNPLYVKAQRAEWFGPTRCPCCGTPMLSHWRAKRGAQTPRNLATIGHDVPLAAGGPHRRYIMICWTCNNDQGVLTFAQWASTMKLTGDPRLNRVIAVVTFFEKEAEPWNPACGRLSASLEQMRVVLSSRATG